MASTRSSMFTAIRPACQPGYSLVGLASPRLHLPLNGASQLLRAIGLCPSTIRGLTPPSRLRYGCCHQPLLVSALRGFSLTLSLGDAGIRVALPRGCLFPVLGPARVRGALRFSEPCSGGSNPHLKVFSSGCVRPSAWLRVFRP
eukprot:249317-Rhodomonas_salina.1